MPKVINNHFYSLTFAPPSIFLSVIQALLTLDLEPDPALKCVLWSSTFCFASVFVCLFYF